MSLRIACQNCKAEYDLPNEKIPTRPARFSCRKCGQEIVLVPAEKGKIEVTGAQVLRDPSTDLPPSFGQFKDLERIASGGMGDVYLAKQGGAEGFEREVILKVLHPHLAREERFVKAMVDEAKLTVAMHHPNIVQMFNLERINNQLCCVMEYVPGKALSAIMRTYRKKGGSLPYPMAVYVVHQMLEGLAYAHELKDKSDQPLNIVHRDISPQNVMVSKDGWVKVIDFGIAKAASRLTHTRTGTVKGKFAYMAPEQYEGRVDQRADIWAAGVVLWEALAGTRLFKGSSDAATMQRVMNMQVPPIHAMRPEVPEAMDRVLSKALAKNPGERYEKARDFKNDLLRAAHPLLLDEMAAAMDIEANCLGGGVVELDADGEDFDSTTPGSMEFGHSQLENSDQQTRSYSSMEEPDTRKRKPSALLMGILGLLLVGVGGGGLWWYLNRDSGGPSPQSPSAVDAGSPKVHGADGGVPATDASQPPDAGVQDAGPENVADGTMADASRQAQVRPKPPRIIKLTRRRIERTLRRHGARLQACADRNLAKDGRSDVKLKLKFSVLRSGKVGVVQLIPKSMESTAFGRCMIKRVKAIRFPRHKDKQVAISIPLQFKVLK